MARILALLALSSLGLAATRAELDVREYCERESFTASCKEDEVIIMRYAEYGRMGKGRCVRNDYGALGCSVNVLPRVHALCSGRRQCEFLISLLHDTQPCPNDLMAYLEAAYECKKVSPCNKDMCARGGYLKLTAASGFLASVVTSETGCGSSACPWVIEPKPGQQLNLTFHNFHTPADHQAASSKYCHRYASVVDKSTKVSKDITVCGHDTGQMSMLTTASAAAEIRLFVGDPSDEQNQAMFLVEYKSIGCPDIIPPDGSTMTRDGDLMTVRCISSSRSWHLTCGGVSWVGEVGICIEGASQVWNIGAVLEDAGTTPTGLVVVVAIGVALGVILGFTMLAIAIIFMKRKQRRQYERAESMVTQSVGSTKLYDKQVPGPDQYYRSYQSRGSLPRPNTRVTASTKSLHGEDDYPGPPPYFADAAAHEETMRRGREHVYESPTTFVGQSPGTMSNITDNTSLSRTSAIV